MSIQQILFAAAGGSTVDTKPAMYWRLTIIGQGTSTGQQRIAELDYSTTTPYYSRQNPSYFVSTPNPSSGSVADIQDGSMASSCIWTINASPATPLHIVYGYTSAMLMKQFRIGITAQNGYFPSAFEVYKSDDSYDWKLVKQFSGVTTWAANEMKTFQLP